MSLVLVSTTRTANGARCDYRCAICEASFSFTVEQRAFTDIELAELPDSDDARDFRARMERTHRCVNV